MKVSSSLTCSIFFCFCESCKEFICKFVKINSYEEKHKNPISMKKLSIIMISTAIVIFLASCVAGEPTYKKHDGFGMNQPTTELFNDMNT